MNNNHNRQSINNYSYSRRRNRESTPAQNGNNSNNYNQSPQNNFNNYSQPPQNSFNNYSQPPQNNFNNYSQPPQNNFNNYSQPPQNNFNNYSQPPQNNFNNYNQPPQNFMPTYQGYDDPMTRSYAGGHHAVEVPLSKKLKKSEMVGFLCFVIPFVLALVAMLLADVTGTRHSFLGNILVPILFGCSFIGMIAGIIVSIIVEEVRLKKVCTVAVTGRLVGYETQMRYIHHKHRRSTSYPVYAPKYEIFINNRYEIRTLNNFTKNQNFSQQLNLLANPDGYEIIRGGNGGVNR